MSSFSASPQIYQEVQLFQPRCSGIRSATITKRIARKRRRVPTQMKGRRMITSCCITSTWESGCRVKSSKVTSLSLACSTPSTASASKGQLTVEWSLTSSSMRFSSARSLEDSCPCSIRSSRSGIQPTTTKEVAEVTSIPNRRKAPIWIQLIPTSTATQIMEIKRKNM